MQIESQIREAISDAGMLVPKQIILDGTIKRFPTNPEKMSKDDGWYVGRYHADGNVGFRFGSWRMGIKKAMFIKGDGSVGGGRGGGVKRMVRKPPKVTDIYEKATDAAGHPYLVRKGINCPEGVKRISGIPSAALGLGAGRTLSGLIVPMYNAAGVISSVQYIPDVVGESKMFAAGIPVAGLYFAIGGSVYGATTICVVEGLATGASVYEATGYVTVVAFSAGNVRRVVSDLAAVIGETNIIVARDNDPAGEKSVEGLGCRVAVPVGVGIGDFNDLHQKEGLEAVRELIVGSVVVGVSKPVITVPGILTSDGKLIRVAEVKSAFAFAHESGELLLVGTGFCDEAVEIVGSDCGAVMSFDSTKLDEFFTAARMRGWTGLVVSDADIGLQYARTFSDVYERWAIAMVESNASFVDRHLDASGYDGWSLRLSSITAASKVFGNLRAPEVVEAKDGSILKWVNVYEKWMHSRTRHTYTEFGFKPVGGKIATPGFKLEPGLFLNLYGGLTMSPMPGDCSLILAHILDVWCYGDEVVYDYVVRWLARMYQYPGERGHTAITLKSGEGAGKNIVLDQLVRSFGRNGLMLSRSDDVVGRFNDALGTSVLVVLNEATWGGDKKTEGVLKSLVTDDRMRCERKHVASYTVPNCCHIIVATNADWAVPVGMDDRRWLVMDVCDDLRGNFEYFSLLSKANFNAFIHYLLHLEIDDFEPRAIPTGRKHASASKADHKLRSADTVTQWWDQVTQTGTIYFEEGYGLFPSNWDDEECSFQKTLAYEAYTKWCRDTGRNRAELISSWAKKLSTFGVDTRERRIVTNQGNRVRGFYVSALPSVRKILTDKLGIEEGGDE